MVIANGYNQTSHASRGLYIWGLDIWVAFIFGVNQIYDKLQKNFRLKILREFLEKIQQFVGNAVLPCILSTKHGELFGVKNNKINAGFRPN